MASDLQRRQQIYRQQLGQLSAARVVLHNLFETNGMGGACPQMIFDMLQTRIKELYQADKFKLLEERGYGVKP